MTIFDFFKLPFKISKPYFFIKFFQIIFDGLYPLFEVYSFSFLVSNVIHYINGKNNYMILSSIIFFAVIFLKYFVDILSLKLSLKPIKKINMYLEKRLIKKNLALEYYYIEDATLYDKLNLTQKQIFDNFIEKHNKISSIIKIVFNLISIIIMIYFSIGRKTLIILFAIVCVYFISDYNGKKSYTQKKEDVMLDRRCDYYSDILCDAKFAEERMIYQYSDYINNKYRSFRNKLIKREKSTKLKNTLRMESSSFLTLLILIYFIIELSNKVKLGMISIGFLIAIIKQLSNFLNIIRWHLFSILETKSELSEYLKEFSELESFTEIKDGTKTIDKINTITIKNLSFNYPNTNKVILDNINYRFESKKSYALLGKNGSGKTTLIKLILNLYHNFTGEILLNNININDISNKSKFSCFAVVFQDYGRYYLTLLENINLGNFDAKKEDIEKAIQLFSLEKIDITSILRKGDDQSVNLSGGEWQNIALARNYISKADIVIFDEPTAALSPSQESKIYSFLKNIIKDKTAIFISHRLGITPLVDEIIVLKDGKIIENGSHKDLMHQNGEYTKMYNSQKELYI